MNFITDSDPRTRLEPRVSLFRFRDERTGNLFVARLSRQCQILFSSACHSSGPISVNTSQILLLYGNNIAVA